MFFWDNQIWNITDNQIFLPGGWTPSVYVHEVTSALNLPCGLFSFLAFSSALQRTFKASLMYSKGLICLLQRGSPNKQNIITC